MDTKTLVETLVRLADDSLLSKLRELAFEYIEIHQAKLDALKQELSGPMQNGSKVIDEVEEETDEEHVTLSDAIERILKTAGRPIGKKEILKRYETLYRRKVSENSIGGALFKRKGVLFEKVGGKGTRYAKWRLMPEIKSKAQLSGN